jgi:uncharacterized protein (DUF58 family)
MSMQRNYTILLVLAGIVTLLLFLFNVWFGLMAVIVLIALIMSVYIMQDTMGQPDIQVTLKDEAKNLEIRNRGNAPAFDIHIAVVPHNIEFDIPALQIDERYTHSFGRMVEEAKVVVTYQTEKRAKYSKTYMLSALGKDDDDLLKPYFPLFKWKEED